MNPIGKIFKNTVILAISKLIPRIGAVIVAFLVARILHATGLGVYTAAMATLDLIASAAQMGTVNLLVREIGKDPTKTNRYLVHLGVISSGVSALLMLLFLLAIPHLGYSADLATGMYIVILAIIPETLSVLQEGVFIAHQRVEFVTYTMLITTLINIAASLYLLLSGFGVISLLIAFVITQFALAALYFFFINRSIARLHWEFDLKFGWALAREIKTFAALAILAAIFSRPEVIVLSIVSSEAQVGFYSAALKVTNLFQLVPEMYMTNVYPVLARSFHLADGNAQAIQDKSVKYILALSLPVTVGTAVAAGPIISLLYGPGFEPSVIVLQILALNMTLNALFSIFWRVLMARDQQDKVLLAMAVVTGLEVVGDFVLISTFASLGAAIITPAISLIYLVILALMLRREGMHTHMVSLSWRFGLASVVMGMAMWALSRSLSLLAVVPMAVVAYVGLTILFRAFSSDDYAFFYGAWRSVAARLGLPSVLWPPRRERSSQSQTADR